MSKKGRSSSQAIEASAAAVYEMMVNEDSEVVHATLLGSVALHSEQWIQQPFVQARLSQIKCVYFLPFSPPFLFSFLIYSFFFFYLPFFLQLNNTDIIISSSSSFFFFIKLAPANALHKATKKFQKEKGGRTQCNGRLCSRVEKQAA